MFREHRGYVLEHADIYSYPICHVCVKKHNIKQKREDTGTITKPTPLIRYEGSIRSVPELERKLYSLLLNSRSRATVKNRAHTLQLHDLLNMFNDQEGRCLFSGRKMSLSGGPTAVSIDRLDSQWGYTVENTGLVCWAVNRMKMNSPVSEFVALCRDVAFHAEQGESKLALRAA